MADKRDSRDSDVDEGADFENVPSELDDNTHAEMLTLYNDSTKSIRFAKHHQWGIVGGTLILFGGFMAIANMTAPNKSFGEQLSGLTILIACAAIFVLILYQFWQHNEASKIKYINTQLSTLFADVRSVKSSMEGNVHRYIFLIFMIFMIIIGAIVCNMTIAKIMLYQ